MNESQVDTPQSSERMRSLSLRQIKGVNNPNSIHGIYPYRGKMSPIDAAQVVSQFPSKSRLLDPFCGTGTIVYEAQVRGLQAIGVDNNPLACTIARGKTEPIDKEATLLQIKAALHAAKSFSGNYEMPSKAAKYFHEVSANQIMRILSISDDFSSFLLACFYGAICLTARACNNWLWTSTSIGKINLPLRQIDFYSTMYRKVKKNLEFVRGTPPARIITHDTRSINEIIPKASIDIVYTSPPYFDALDYTAYYSKLVLEILGADRAEIRSGLIQSYSTYETEMRKALFAIDEVVHDKSIIIFVVGDRMVNGKLVRGSDFFSRIAPWDMPSIVERQYTKSPSRLWDRINMTSRKEQVIVWDLSKGGWK